MRRLVRGAVSEDVLFSSCDVFRASYTFE